jgi:hypothetical protein
VSGKPAKHNGKKTFCQKDNTRLKEEKKRVKNIKQGKNPER